ncbi:hypothetical protein UFOVP119_52 [uncultured Caudovirales phage]|uniref:Uncharacterized protein n=1 Tax=uncultured Caudovirales phage TaxID=2100421 RepID=A0A6J5L733_9CAUD|nr:hypothetical protein UFOVP119_52 [uncultured Caudovirales phage]
MKAAALLLLLVGCTPTPAIVSACIPQRIFASIADRVEVLCTDGRLFVYWRKPT